MQEITKFCYVFNKNPARAYIGGISFRACLLFFKFTVQKSKQYICKNQMKCELIAGKSICQFCRFLKCQKIGMKAQYVKKQKNKMLKCKICNDNLNGSNFGGVSCNSCNKFYQYSVRNNKFGNFICNNDNLCEINVENRKHCQFCRFKKFQSYNMNTKLFKM